MKETAGLVRFGIVLKKSMEPDILLWSMFLKSEKYRGREKSVFLFIIVFDL